MALIYVCVCIYVCIHVRVCVYVVDLSDTLG